MKQIKMLFNGKIETFTIIYECDTYIFCECRENPAARGFFTSDYINKNKQ